MSEVVNISPTRMSPTISMRKYFSNNKVTGGATVKDETVPDSA